MAIKVNQDFPLSFPGQRYRHLQGLASNALMSPSFLSKLVSYAVLPGQIMVNRQPLANNEHGFCTLESWYRRSYGQNYNIEFTNPYYDQLSATHSFSALSVDGLETLEAKNANADEYEIFFCGNAQDGMSFDLAYSRITANPNKNYIFWNYPGVGCSKGDMRIGAQDLFDAGLQQVTRLLEAKVPAAKITLHGLSLGGGVASQVATALYDNGQVVNLEVDRSFSNIAEVIPEAFKLNITEPDTGLPMLKAPLVSSVTAFAVSGITLGTTLAGFISSVGLVMGATCAGVSYLMAYCIKALGYLMEALVYTIGQVIALPFSFFSPDLGERVKNFFDALAYYAGYPLHLTALVFDKLMQGISSFLDHTVNFFGSLAGAGVSLVGATAGVLSGLILGAIMSIQWAWTNNPLLMPMGPAFRAAIFSSCFSMDSVDELTHLFNETERPRNLGSRKPEVSVINTLDDEIIPVGASLNRGLGFHPGQAQDATLQGKMHSFWYQKGGHMGKVSEQVEPGVAPSL